MDNKQIAAQRARLDTAWKNYCAASRWLQQLNTRKRGVKKVREEWLEEYYYPAEKHFYEKLQALIDEAMADG